jgi:hypothetical protein
MSASAGAGGRRAAFLANYAAFASGRLLKNVIDLERQY